MGKSSRNKGKKGNREAKNLLLERDWTILADTSDGISTEDLIAKSQYGTVYSVEVKNRKLINMLDFRKQASASAKKTKLPWMILAKICGTRSWIMWMQGNEPVIWHERRGE